MLCSCKRIYILIRANGKNAWLCRLKGRQQHVLFTKVGLYGVTWMNVAPDYDVLKICVYSISKSILSTFAPSILFLPLV